MKRKIIAVFTAIAMLVATICFVNVDFLEAFADSVPTVTYRTHVQNVGWQEWKSNGQMSGTQGRSLRLEGIELKVSGDANLGIQYTTHVQNYGWLPWAANGEMSGTQGESKRLEAIKIRLTGANAGKYDIYYRVHAQNKGWMAWAKNGQAAGTAGYAYRLEGIQIVIVPKGGSFNRNCEGFQSTVTTPYVATNGSNDASVADTPSPTVMYRTHVQNVGWQNWVKNGDMSGTSGRSLRLEGINIRLLNKAYPGGITYHTHVQNIGWQGWVSDGAMSGTSGLSYRLEGIEIKLTGEIANHYDVYYRTHVQNVGWQDWRKNGEMSGTSGRSLRLEGIEIRLVKRGDPSPQKETECVHNWVVNTKVVHHEEQGHLVYDYDPKDLANGYVIGEDEELYTVKRVYATYCRECMAINGSFDGLDYYTDPDGKDFFAHIEKTGHTGGTYNCWLELPDKKISKKAIWVVDKPAYDETISNGYRCTKCGATR